VGIKAGFGDGLSSLSMGCLGKDGNNLGMFSFSPVGGREEYARKTQYIQFLVILGADRTEASESGRIPGG